ncbi:hypothetical protein MGSAQ_001371 [marine sediment metagenome]|uniref:Uncharacterized protein n=1 Tax=marine sediment metagenome TaxID=412755 RepID=A0A1B6NUJ0_9ZZZZ
MNYKYLDNYLKFNNKAYCCNSPLPDSMCARTNHWNCSKSAS